MDFESQLNDKTAPIAIDFDKAKNVLLIAFGGFAHKIGFSMFEFNKITSGMKNINKIYIRDKNRLYYHRGLPNVGNNIDSIANHLCQYTTHPSTHRVVVFGNSAGGYAALLFGHILQVDEVHAFSPKTLIDPIKRLRLNNLPRKHRTRIILSSLPLFFHGQAEYFDLKRFFETSLENKVDFHLYFPSGHKIDTFQTSRMKNLPNVYCHPYKYHKHNLIKVLKQTGELSEIIGRAIILQK